MLESLRKNDFNKIYEIMEQSFPSDEYRPFSEQEDLLKNSAYKIYALYDEDSIIKGFLSVWDFSEFAFIEHFAVNSSFRNGGIGAYMLSEILKKFNKLMCLEVEPPDTEISKRRIGFYQRNNFHLNEYAYVQPAISKGKNAIPLYIMTSGKKVEKDMFEHIKNTLYANVYKCI